MSMGGAVAAHVVAREKHRIKSLVLLAPVAEGEGILDELSTPEAVSSLAETGITDHDGNLVGVAFIRQFAEMKPLREVVKCQCPVLIDPRCARPDRSRPSRRLVRARAANAQARRQESHHPRRRPHL